MKTIQIRVDGLYSENEINTIKSVIESLRKDS
jgi:hypothetical protein